MTRTLHAALAQRTRRTRCLGPALAGALALFLALPAAAVDVLDEVARVGWQGATGPVVGYAIYVRRNGSPFLLEGFTGPEQLEYEVQAFPGDRLRIQVAALGPDGQQGPFSETSGALRFVAPDSGVVDPGNTVTGSALVITGAPGEEPLDAPGASVDVQVHEIGGTLIAFESYTQALLPPGVELAAIPYVRGASCQLDGDDDREFVLGFGVGSGGLVEIREATQLGFAHIQWLAVEPEPYASENGETFPACGDVDGDGRDELVIGLGPGGGGRTRIYDDRLGGFALLRELAVQWPTYNAENGESRPALGDFDGDGRDEIVLGLGEGGNGFLMVYDDAARSYRRFPTSYGSGWILAESPDFEGADGATFPTLGDVDGDNLDEIVVGFGEGGFGRIRIYDDVTGYLEPYETLDEGFTSVASPAYQALVGITRPLTGDLDGDGAEEVLVGLAPEPRGRIRSGGIVRVLRSAYGNFTPAVDIAVDGWFEIDAWHLSPRGTSLVGP